MACTSARGLTSLAAVISVAALASLSLGCSRDATPPAAAGANTTTAATEPAAASPAVATPAANPATKPAEAAPAAAAAATEVEVGKAAPDFTAKAHDGTNLHLAALKGKPVVVYFYPKDETPGCTKEACSFRDAWNQLGKKALLIGISADDEASHKKFAEHHKLPFLLVSDPDGTIAKSYGVPFKGFPARQTFVIGPDGNVKKIYRTVDVTKHAQEIQQDLG